MTTWAIAVGYYGKYEVSSDGRIRNIITGKILIPSVSKTGYLFVKLDRPDLPRKKRLCSSPCCRSIHSKSAKQVASKSQGRRQNE